MARLQQIWQPRSASGRMHLLRAVGVACLSSLLPGGASTAEAQPSGAVVCKFRSRGFLCTAATLPAADDHRGRGVFTMDRLTVSGRRRAYRAHLKPGWVFDPEWVTWETTTPQKGVVLALLTCYWFGGSGYSFETRLLQLRPRSGAVVELRKYSGELPGGYLFTSTKSVLFWWSVWGDREAHDASHHFRFDEFRLARGRLRHVRSSLSRKKYPRHLDDQAEYRWSPEDDPLREVGARWPIAWTEDSKIGRFSANSNETPPFRSGPSRNKR